MAAVLKLNWGTVNVDLLTGTALNVMTWTPKLATPEPGRLPEPVTETLTVRASGSTHDTLAANLQPLHDMQRWAKTYIEDRSGTTPVWLHAKMTNETGERRALVRRIDAEFISPWYGPSANANPTVMLSMAIEREPYWEGTAAGTALQGSAPVAAAAVVYDYTGGGAVDIPGDVGARIGNFAVTVENANALGRVWAGLRSANKHGALDNFVPIWECEDTDATLGTDAARTTDTTASPGGGGDTKVRVTPGTATWAKRLTITLGNVTANYSDNYGRFLWLLREKVSAGTWEVQLRFGYPGMVDGSMVQGPIVQVTNTNWDYAEMGIGDMPFIDQWAPPDVDRNEGQFSSIQIWARRTAGSGTFDLDCLCPVPIDEGFLKVGAWNTGAADNGSSMVRYHSPRGPQVIAYGTTNERPAVHEDNFYFPPGDGRMIIVHANASTANITDQIDINSNPNPPNGQYYSRWLSLRGGE